MIHLSPKAENFVVVSSIGRVIDYSLQW